MFRTTLERLECPRCGSGLELGPVARERSGDILLGAVVCAADCGGEYPILNGVAVLVPEPGEYLLQHAKGVSRSVRIEEIPEAFREDFQQVLTEIQEAGEAHQEDDLEADRVTALYLMTQFLPLPSPGAPKWWQGPGGSEASPWIEELILRHWESGPLSRIAEWGQRLPGDWIEIGCGVGGLGARLQTRSYLGVDSSFASIALARQVVLGVEPSVPLLGPRDLLEGQLVQQLRFREPVSMERRRIDYVVGDAEALPVKKELFDVSASLNMIDMLEDPAHLPALQRDLLRPGGVAIQSCPYVWHPWVAGELRKKLPPGIQDSARAVEWLYEQAGLKKEEGVDHVPWLFFKHIRQVELYSVHLLRTRKS